eukprot:Clim_evm3s77 gene=Clim_evmTU3s77
MSSGNNPREEPATIDLVSDEEGELVDNGRSTANQRKRQNSASTDSFESVDEFGDDGTVKESAVYQQVINAHLAAGGENLVCNSQSKEFTPLVDITCLTSLFTLVYAGTGTGGIIAMDGETMRIRYSLPGSTNDAIVAITTLVTRPELFFTCDLRGRVKVWNAVDGSEKFTLALDMSEPCLSMVSLAMGLAVLCDRTITFFDVTVTGDLRKGQQTLVCETPVTAMVPQGVRVVVGHMGGKITSRSIYSGKQSTGYLGHTSDISYLVIKHGLLYSGAVDGKVMVHALSDGAELAKFEAGSSPVLTILFQEKLNRILIAVEAGDVSLWDASRYTRMATIFGGTKGERVTLTAATAGIDNIFAATGEVTTPLEYMMSAHVQDDDIDLNMRARYITKIDQMKGPTFECRWSECKRAFSALGSLAWHVGESHMLGLQEHHSDEKEKGQNAEQDDGRIGDQELDCQWAKADITSVMCLFSSTPLGLFNHVVGDHIYEEGIAKIAANLKVRKKGLYDPKRRQKYGFHTRLYTTEESRWRNHPCAFPECAVIAGSRERWIEHMKTHKGQFRCGQSSCQNVLYDFYSLIVHCRLHSATLDTPKQCPTPGCGRWYATTAQLNAHIAQCGNLPFVCKISWCSRRFRSNVLLEHHVQNFHKSTEEAVNKEGLNREGLREKQRPRKKGRPSWRYAFTPQKDQHHRRRRSPPEHRQFSVTGDKVSRAFHILNLPRDSNERAVVARYRQLAKLWHPDRYADASKDHKTDLHAKFADISWAYRTIRTAKG